MKNAPDPDVIEGRRLVAEKNCKGCHIIEGLGGDNSPGLAGQLAVAAEPDTQVRKRSRIPPLFPEGSGSRPASWWLDTRMPTFHFTEHQVALSEKYFARLDKVDWAGSMPKSKALRRTSPPASNSLKRVSVQNAIHGCRSNASAERTAWHQI